MSSRALPYFNISFNFLVKNFHRRYSGRTTVVPNHPGEKLDRGLLNKILSKDVLISREEFEKYL